VAVAQLSEQKVSAQPFFPSPKDVKDLRDSGHKQIQKFEHDENRAQNACRSHVGNGKVEDSAGAINKPRHPVDPAGLVALTSFLQILSQHLFDHEAPGGMGYEDIMTEAAVFLIQQSAQFPACSAYIRLFPRPARISVGEDTGCLQHCLL